MANLYGIARPYALAAFQYACEKQQLPAWNAFLTSASTIAEHSSVIKLLGNPECSTEKLFSLFHEILKPLLDTERNNFIRLLADNRRFNILPEIAHEFNALHAAYLKTTSVRVITAVDVEDGFKQKLMQALTKRVNREVTLHCEVDPTIIGGAIIHLGDRVIDGSVRGKLTRLLEISLR